MGSKGPSEHTTTQTSGPPEWAVPYAQHGLTEARNLYETRPLYQSTSLPEEAQAGFSAAQELAQNPYLVNPATQLAQRTLGGEFLGADALRSAARNELDDVIGGTLSGFERAGRSGSGLAMNALGRGVTSALAPQYARERGMQQQAMMGAPAMEAFRYMPAEQQIGMGMRRRGLEERYYQEPWERLGRYSGLLQGTMPLAGTVGTQTQPIYQPSPLSQIAGLGMTALGAYMGGPMGAQAGAAAGRSLFG